VNPMLMIPNRECGNSCRPAKNGREQRGCVGGGADGGEPEGVFGAGRDAAAGAG
jgi:hypothetical protein